MAAGAGTVDYRAVARRAAAKYGLVGRDQEIFLRKIGAESGFNPRAKSPAGAIGIAQFMPGTARGAGIDPWDPVASLFASAKMDAERLRTYGGNWEDVLEAYNAGPGAVNRSGPPRYAETRSYVNRIMGGLGTGDAAAGRVYGVVDQGDEANPVVEQAAPRLRTVALPGMPAVRAFRVNPRLAERLAYTQEGAAPVFPRSMTVETPGRRTITMPDQMLAGQQPGFLQQGSGGVMGSLIGRPLDRQGVATRQPIIDFARRVAGLYGKPITLGTGTRHNRMTTSGNVSAHWAGNALDLPATGAQLTAMGQAALIAAGMPAAEARRHKSGLFNIGGYQVIFGTNTRAQGGNHLDHLHVALSGGRR